MACPGKWVWPTLVWEDVAGAQEAGDPDTSDPHCCVAVATGDDENEEVEYTEIKEDQVQKLAGQPQLGTLKWKRNSWKKLRCN